MMSWKRFEEFDFGAAKNEEKEKKQKTKRKSLDSSSVQVLKKRRRSLCFSYSSRNKFENEEETQGSTNRPNPRKEDQIEDFSSSSSEEEKPSFVGNLLNDVTTYEHASNLKNKSSFDVKRNVWKRANQIAHDEKQKDSTSILAQKSNFSRNLEAIDWSESEDESPADIKPRKCSKLSGKFEATDNIGKFDSPAKNESQASSQISIIECPPSPEKQEEPKGVKLEPEDNGDDYLPKPLDSSTKRRKDLKDGLVCQLRKVISRENSELVFWRHTNEARISSCGGDASGTRKALILKVLSKDIAFSMSLLKCQTIEDSPKEIYILIPQSKIMKFDINAEDTLLKVYQPWQKLKLPNTTALILIGVFFFEVISDLTEIYRNDVNSGFDYVDIEGDRTETSSSNLEKEKANGSKRSYVQANFGISFAKEFESCKFWKESCFSAVVKGVYIYTNNMLPIMPSSNTELLEILKMNYTGNQQRIPEVMLLLEDTKNTYAAVSLPQSLVTKICNGKNFSCLQGCTLNFAAFVLKSVKSNYSDPVLFSLIENLKQERGMLIGNAIQDKPLEDCFVFSCTHSSSIKLVSSTAVQAEALIMKQESLKESSYEPKEIEGTYAFTRLSVYAYCICTIPGHQNKSELDHSTIFIAVLKIRPSVHGDDGLFSRKSSQSIFSLQILPAFYVPNFIKDNLMDNKIIFLEDVLLQDSSHKKLIADRYTQITFVEPENLVTEELKQHLDSYTFIEETQFHTLSKMQLNIFEPLSYETPELSLALVNGVICGIDCENAFCWKICSICSTEPDNSQAQATRFFCKTCNDHVDSKICVQLEVFLKNPNLVNLVMQVKLLEKTVFDYLPAKIGDDFQGFDVECILGKIFGPVPCYLREKTKSIDTGNNELRIDLEEINISKRFSGRDFR